MTTGLLWQPACFSRLLSFCKKAQTWPGAINTPQNIVSKDFPLTFLFHVFIFFHLLHHTLSSGSMALVINNTVEPLYSGHPI